MYAGGERHTKKKRVAYLEKRKKEWLDGGVCFFAVDTPILVCSLEIE